MSAPTHPLRQPARKAAQAPQLQLQVGVSDAKALAAAQPRCRLTIVKGMNHILKLVPSDWASQRASYGDPSLPIAPVASQAITAFLREQLTDQER